MQAARERQTKGLLINDNHYCNLVSGAMIMIIVTILMMMIRLDVDEGE